MLPKSAIVVAVSLISLAASAQMPACRDIADEPNHQLVFQNADVRIYRLELPSGKATEEFCVAHGYLRVIATEGHTADLVANEATYGQDWKLGEARFVYQPKRKAIRNDSGSLFREYDIETLHPVEYNPLYHNNYDMDLFGGDVGEFKADKTVSATVGSLKASKITLGTGEKISVGDLPHFLIALTDVDLTYGQDKRVTLNKSEATQIGGGATVELKNNGSRIARFVTVEF